MTFSKLLPDKIFVNIAIWCWRRNRAGGYFIVPNENKSSGWRCNMWELFLVQISAPTTAQG